MLATAGADARPERVEGRLERFLSGPRLITIALCRPQRADCGGVLQNGRAM